MKWNIPVFSIVLFISILAISTNTYPAAFNTAIVKLYSDGKVVGEWEAINEGYMEGQCFVFNIRKGAYSPQVRVCGTFSIEYKK